MTSIRQVATVEDALRVLPIRNEARHFMTRHRSPITEEQQRQWFDKWVRTGEKSLYLVEALDKTVGYGLIGWDPDPDHEYAALTAALAPEFRGSGFGRMIFGFLVCEVRIRRKVPWIEVLASNAAARSLYRKLGFVETTRASTEPHRDGESMVVDEVISMVHAK